MEWLKVLYTRNKVTPAYVALWPVLFLLSCIYALLLLLRHIFYKTGIFKSYRPGLKVISIGNITLGGTGKTPFAVYLAKRLSGAGQKAAILLRGYKRPRKDCSMGHAAYSSLGDEGSMLKENLGTSAEVLASPDRALLALELEKQKKVSTLILDDGFGHLRLKRDLDIVTVDASNPFGNRCILPLGPLREPVFSLKRADCFCLTRCDEVPEDKVKGLEYFLRQLNPGAVILKAVHAADSLYNLTKDRKEPLDILKGRNVCLLAGIANPGSFLNTAQKLGANPVLKVFFDDHYHYSNSDMIDIITRCSQAGVNSVLTTQKDAARLAGFSTRQRSAIDLLVLKITLKIIEGEEELSGRLLSLYSR